MNYFFWWSFASALLRIPVEFPAWPAPDSILLSPFYTGCRINLWSPLIHETREKMAKRQMSIYMLTFISNGQSTRTAKKKRRKKLKLWNCDNKRKIKSELVYTIFMINNEWNRKWRWKDIRLSNVPRGQKIQHFYKLVL